MKGVVLGLVTILATVSSANAEVFLGKVTDIASGGALVIDNTRTARLWALSITDVDAFRAFMLDRKVYCSEVSSRKFVDCFIAARTPNSTMQDMLRAIVWLPEFGLAKVQCGNVDMTLDVETSRLGFGAGRYACTKDVVEYPWADLNLGRIEDLSRLLELRRKP